MKGIGTKNPDTFIKTNDDHQIKAILAAIPHDNVKYEVWKKVKVPNDKGGKSNDDAFKTKMKLIIEGQAKEDFTANLVSQIQEFRSHVDRISAQHKQMKLLKDGLEDNELILSPNGLC